MADKDDFGKAMEKASGGSWFKKTFKGLLTDEGAEASEVPEPSPSPELEAIRNRRQRGQ